MPLQAVDTWSKRDQSLIVQKAEWMASFRQSTSLSGWPDITEVCRIGLKRSWRTNRTFPFLVIHSTSISVVLNPSMALLIIDVTIRGDYSLFHPRNHVNRIRNLPMMNDQGRKLRWRGWCCLIIVLFSFSQHFDSIQTHTCGPPIATAPIDTSLSLVFLLLADLLLFLCLPLLLTTDASSYFHKLTCHT